MDLDNGLKTLYWTADRPEFKDHVTLLAGNGVVLGITVTGELILLKAARDAFTPIARLRVFEGVEVWSHPALVGNRLYLRSMNEIACILLNDSP